MLLYLHESTVDGRQHNGAVGSCTTLAEGESPQGVS